MFSPDLIELCAGTAAVSLAAMGASKFPCSRVGNKVCYVDPILEELGISGRIEQVLLVEADQRLASLMIALFQQKSREQMVRDISAIVGEEARVVWNQAKDGTSPADTLLWLAGARGGVGGFKGAHCLRPNVDGFIPSRRSLIKRLECFQCPGEARVIITDVSLLNPALFAPAAVYIDPPYQGRQGYRAKLCEPVQEIAQRWAKHGHRVVVSEAFPLPGRVSCRDITKERRGQTRRSLTVCDSEWLSVFNI